MAKSVTFDQAAAKKDNAERFVRDVLGDDSRADEIADEDVQSYADRKHLNIIDNTGKKGLEMANAQSRQDLLDEIRDLQDENDDLRDQLSAIGDSIDGVDDDDSDDDSDDSDAG